jgi:hypothetical protein
MYMCMCVFVLQKPSRRTGISEVGVNIVKNCISILDATYIQVTLSTNDHYIIKSTRCELYFQANTTISSSKTIFRCIYDTLHPCIGRGAPRGARKACHKKQKCKKQKETKRTKNVGCSQTPNILNITHSITKTKFLNTEYYRHFFLSHF